VTEIPLPHGDVTPGVVRVGDTVRRPHQPQSVAVGRYLEYLERVGFAGAPRYLGRDDAGRDVLSYLEGEVPGDPPEAWAATDTLLASVGALLRGLHEASAGFVAAHDAVWAHDLVRVPDETPLPPSELVSHLDVTPQNTIVRSGIAVGLVDFDLAGPTTRLLDVYNTAMHWVPLRDPRDLYPDWPDGEQPTRLRLFADAYGLSRADRLRLPELGIERARASHRRMQAAAEQLGGGWARMWREGVGDLIRRREAWLHMRREEFTAALD
jgi:hypothetical protein